MFHDSKMVTVILFLVLKLKLTQSSNYGHNKTILLTYYHCHCDLTMVTMLRSMFIMFHNMKQNRKQMFEKIVPG